MKKILLPSFSILLVGVAALLLVWLAMENFPAAGSMAIKAVLGRSLPMISSLGPEVRTKLTPDYQAILESPVYFDLRAMPWFNKAIVTIVYQEVGNHVLVGLGRHTGPDFNFQLAKADSVATLASGDKKAVFRVNLQDFYQQKNIYRFLLDTSNHQYQTGSELRIKSLNVVLSK